MRTWETVTDRLIDRIRELEDRLAEVEQRLEDMAVEQLPSAIGFEAGESIEFDEDDAEYRGADL
jgi:hypothetical protein